jgi:dinuclear metal center YbgI/SA1388 family protein
MKIKDITNYLEKMAPPAYQESYDNAGLITGNKKDELKGVLITLDSTEEIVDEAIQKNANLIIAHHPIIFKGLTKIVGNNYVERTIIKAIKNDIAIYAIHTNLDNVLHGVNAKLCEKLGLQNCKILRPEKGELRKLVTFIPKDHIDSVRNVIFKAGAGHIGNYDCCSFNLQGIGTFKAGEGTSPFVGKKNEIHLEDEIRFESIYPRVYEGNILKALFTAHPYEEVAYDIYPLDNIYEKIGAGMTGELENETDISVFLNTIKENLNTKMIRHTKLVRNKIKRIALCGGAGSFLLKDAIRAKADIFISGDFKYHEFFDTENKIVIADIGHYESEQFTKELIYDILKKKFSNFACFLSEINTNPVNYL